MRNCQQFSLMAILAYLGPGTACAPLCDASDPACGANEHPAADGATFWYANRCDACHCGSAAGGCDLNAPDIRGASREELDANLRFEPPCIGNDCESPGPFEAHPLKRPDASDQDIENLDAFLWTRLWVAQLSGELP